MARAQLAVKTKSVVHSGAPPQLEEKFFRRNVFSVAPGSIKKREPPGQKLPTAHTQRIFVPNVKIVVLAHCLSANNHCQCSIRRRWLIDETVQLFMPLLVVPAVIMPCALELSPVVISQLPNNSAPQKLAENLRRGEHSPVRLDHATREGIHQISMINANLGRISKFLQSGIALRIIKILVSNSSYVPVASAVQ